MNQANNLITNHFVKSQTASFTLIELLVVIAIISSLSALLVPNFMGARERARDAQRKSDLKQIQKALEMYKQDQSPPAYPTAILCGSATCFPNSGNQWASGTTIYMNKVPKDPNRTDNNGYYYYNVDNTNLTYTLCACLENTADSDAEDGDCDTNYNCSNGKKYVVNQP